ncbi:MAG: NADH-quinone oxidoreductase subunit NuoE [Hyphomicrobiales bacterium]|jgi:NADH-quinone oxidoreductase subunit E|nr:NADH-quinone oxidoreductase subunit NuoE [Hyphomicrobiales bacterium]
MNEVNKNKNEFCFSSKNKILVENELKKYPKGRETSAIISLLWIAQKQNGGWLSTEIIEYVAFYLNIPKIRSMEIATFYSMFNLSPVGKYHFQMCGTTPCMLCGSDSLKEVLSKKIGAQSSVTDDKLFSWIEVECLGACCNAPVIQINDDYYEDLHSSDLEIILDNLKNNKSIKDGSYKKRISSEPLNKDLKMLTEDEIQEMVKNRKKPGISA